MEVIALNNTEAVEMLEVLLNEAKTGKIDSIAFVACSTDEFRVGWSIGRNACVAQALGAIEILKTRVMRSEVEGIRR